jgi:hypothetical protein
MFHNWIKFLNPKVAVHKKINHVLDELENRFERFDPFDRFGRHRPGQHHHFDEFGNRDGEQRGNRESFFDFKLDRDSFKDFFNKQ